MKTGGLNGLEMIPYGEMSISRNKLSHVRRRSKTEKMP